MKRILQNSTLLLLFLPSAARLWAGPPFQTDDPEPVDFRHYEFYTFGGADGTPVETDPFGPAFEFNWGAVSNLQLHSIFPLGSRSAMRKLRQSHPPLQYNFLAQNIAGEKDKQWTRIEPKRTSQKS